MGGVIVYWGIPRMDRLYEAARRLESRFELAAGSQRNDTAAQSQAGVRAARSIAAADTMHSLTTDNSKRACAS